MGKPVSGKETNFCTGTRLRAGCRCGLPTLTRDPTRRSGKHVQRDGLGVIEVADFSSDAGDEERALDQRERHGGGTRHGVFWPVVVAEMTSDHRPPLVEAVGGSGLKTGTDDRRFESGRGDRTSGARVFG
jgi:hypothetical protein